MNLLVIRPQPGADATAARVGAAGHQAIVAPLFEVQSVAWDVPDPDGYDAVLFSSGNAVRQLGGAVGWLRALPLYAVGSATARAMNANGMNVAATGDGGMAVLLDQVRRDGHRRLLWLAGEDRTAVEIPTDMTLDVRTVYRSAKVPPPGDFGDQVRACDAVMLHSARAASYFATICDDCAIDRASLTLAVLSPVFAANAGSGWRTIVAAPAPHDASLLMSLQSRFTKDDCDP